jgi:hypothetical protein
MQRGSKARREADRLRSDQRPADVELNLGVCQKRHTARVSEVAAPVQKRGYPPGARPDLVWAQRLLPHVEELTERVYAPDWGFAVNDPVGCMGVPRKAAPHAANGPCGVDWIWSGGAMPTPYGICRCAPATKIVRWTWMW